MVDILTLKDNLDNTDDYATALHILARVRVGFLALLSILAQPAVLEHA